METPCSSETGIEQDEEVIQLRIEVGGDRVHAYLNQVVASDDARIVNLRLSRPPLYYFASVGGPRGAAQ